MSEERRAEDKENDRAVLEEEQHIPPPVAPRQIVRADDEHANMQLQANEDDGTEEQRAQDKGTIKDGDLQSN